MNPHNRPEVLPYRQTLEFTYHAKIQDRTLRERKLQDPSLRRTLGVISCSKRRLLLLGLHSSTSPHSPKPLSHWLGLHGKVYNQLTFLSLILHILSAPTNLTKEKKKSLVFKYTTCMHIYNLKNKESNHYHLLKIVTFVNLKKDSPVQ